MSELDKHLKKHREQIINQEKDTFRDLADAYRSMWNEIEPAYRVLEKQIETAWENGEEVSPAWYLRESRLKNLLARISEQLAQFSDTAIDIIKRDQQKAIEIAVEQAQENYNFFVAKAEGETQPNPKAFSGGLNTRIVETAVGMMHEDSPLDKYFKQQMKTNVIQTKREILKGAAIGTSFSEIARRLAQRSEVTKQRAYTIARTEINRIRRETTRLIYQDNGDLISAWEWLTSKSLRTCLLCLAMDGRTFPLEKSFPHHVNCRCTMIPVIDGLKKLPRTMGKDWFEAQPEDVQKSIMGKEAFAKYRAHDLELSDFVAFRTNRYGQSVMRKSLKRVLSDKNLLDVSDFEELRLPANVRINFGNGAKERIDKLLGKNISHSEIGALFGALDGAHVEITTVQYQTNLLEAKITHPLVEKQLRTLDRDEDGRLYIHNSEFETKETAPPQTGLRSFATQVFTAQKLGVEYINTVAAGYKGHPDYVGYYVWARMGYNAELRATDIEKLPKKYEHLEDVNQLILAGGKKDWESHGTERNMLFDLNDDSSCIEILKNYLIEKKIVVKF